MNEQAMNRLKMVTAILSALIVIMGTVWYVYLVVTHDPNMKPVLATWIVLAGTMALSFATYWTSPKRSIISNACNAASVISTSSILIAVAIVTIMEGKNIQFTLFQKWSLAASFAIMMFWVFKVWVLKHRGILPNVLTQILMVVGYVVTAERLWHATHCTEPMFTWVCIALGSIVGMCPAVIGRDKLAMLYTTRATVTTTTLIWLMIRAGH